MVETTQFMNCELDVLKLFLRITTMQVDPELPPEGAEVTHINHNDGSRAGLAFSGRNIMSLQYHPEASPGPHDSDPVFSEFVELMKQLKTCA